MVALAQNDCLSPTEMLGLLRACPWTQSNPSECPLHELRKLPLAELYQIVRRATSADLSEFAAVCDGCPCRCPMPRRRSSWTLF